jgi:hypothetical protein
MNEKVVLWTQSGSRALLTLLVVLLLAAIVLPPVRAIPGWNDRRIIYMHNSGSALTEYQVLVTLNTSNFDYSVAKVNGSDLRFTDDQNTLTYPYWVETWNSSGESRIWVKVASIPHGDSKMFIWYNNSTASSESNGSATFDFFDDFDDGNISDWTTSCSYNDVGGESCTYSNNSDSISSPYSMSLYGYASCGGPSYNGVLPTVSQNMNLTNGTYKLDFYETGWGGQWGFCSSGTAAQNYAYNDSTQIYSGGTTCSYTGCGRCSSAWEYAVSDAFTVTNGSTTVKLAVRVTDCEEGRGWFDDVRVRKYASPEPTISLPVLLPTITSFTPPSPVDDSYGIWRLFTLTADQLVNVNWYLDGNLQFTNVSVQEATCTLHAEVVGGHNVSALASNDYETALQTWLWTVQTSRRLGGSHTPRDSDGDGYGDIEEMLAETDQNDPDDYPGKSTASPAPTSIPKPTVTPSPTPPLSLTPTPAQTPTPPPEEDGSDAGSPIPAFEAVFAIAGLLTVACLVRRRIR